MVAVLIAATAVSYGWATSSERYRNHAISSPAQPSPP
jgi:hypothetical protein